MVPVPFGRSKVAPMDLLTHSVSVALGTGVKVGFDGLGDVGLRV